MRVIVTNKTDKDQRTAWPIKGELKAGGTAEFEVEEIGARVPCLLGFANMMQSKGIMGFQVFKGKPEKEYKVISGGSFPKLVEV